MRNFGSHIGRAEVADEVVGPNFTELWISIDPDVDYHSTLAKIQEVVDGYPAFIATCKRISASESKKSLRHQRDHRRPLYGPDLPGLRAKAKEVEHAMAQVSGVANLKVEPQVLIAQVDVRLRPQAQELFGLTPGHVRRATTTLLKGTKVGEVVEGQKKFDVVAGECPPLVSISLRSKMCPSILQPACNVRLGEVADVAIVPSPNEIKREGASRRLDITCNVDGRDLGSVAREIEEKVRAIPFDREYHPEFIGEFAARQEASTGSSLCRCWRSWESCWFYMLISSRSD